MREIRRIILHTTATTTDVDAETVRRWHVNGNGWQDIGYHFLVRMDGSIEHGRPITQQGAHTKGENGDSIGIAFSGGKNPLTEEPWDTRTPEQRNALHGLVNVLWAFFPSIVSVHGHNEFNPGKACPCFDVAKEFGHLRR